MKKNKLKIVGNSVASPKTKISELSFSTLPPFNISVPCLSKLSLGLLSCLWIVGTVNCRSIQAQESASVSESTESILTVSDSEDSSTIDNVVSTSDSNDNIPTAITVENFEVTGNTVFSEAEIQNVVSEYQDRPLSISELFQVRTAITKLYTDSGYVNSGAYIPPQELEDGTVTIAVLEGKLEGINVTGTKRLNADYVRSRLEIAADSPLNVDSLLEALQLLRLDPLIKNVSAELSAGISPGTSLLDVEIEEADAFKIRPNLDNKRSPSVGSFRRGIGLSHANLLGFGDRISFDYNNTDGSNSIDASYAIPINAKNGTIRLAYGYSDNDIIEDPFNALDIESESSYYELGFRQPLIVKPNQEFTMGMNFSFQESQTKLLDTPFALSRGAEEDGETKIGAIRLFQEYVARNDRQVFALRSQFSIGIDIFGSTINDNAPDSSFFAWRGQSQWVRRLDEDFLFLLRGDLQFSASDLVALEQFRVGGFDSVRGYRQDLVLGDNGLSASAEVRVPLVRFRKIDGVIQLTPFFDLGTVWNNDDSDIDNDFLASIGIGLNFNVADSFNARLDWGIPLIDVDNQGDTLQESGLHFSITGSF
ncbi:MAG: ShlB/FhaC/HecB family hemolysin secretion/activation protein [Xenococcaceae cyanobacterium MO_188.B19]|nr:ShlB/FhaC/HecB family hemolysin secretion/activation protein [Xenococcaceae cyanobacterium MO_188.B19]